MQDTPGERAPSARQVLTKTPDASDTSPTAHGVLRVSRGALVAGEYLVNIDLGRTAQKRVTGGRWRRIVAGAQGEVHRGTPRLKLASV